MEGLVHGVVEGRLEGGKRARVVEGFGCSLDGAAQDGSFVVESGDGAEELRQLLRRPALYGHVNVGQPKITGAPSGFLVIRSISNWIPSSPSTPRRAAQSKATKPNGDDPSRVSRASSRRRRWRRGQTWRRHP